MAKPYDATTKHLLEAHPEDWLTFAGFPPAEVVTIESDLSTVTSEADKVLLVKADSPWLLHLELQSGFDAELAGRILRYNVLLAEREQLPVHSTVVLLRPQADGPHLSGELVRSLPGGRRYLTFQFGVVRVWQRAVEDVLTGGLGTLPLAPLCSTQVSELPQVIDAMKQRIGQEAKPAEAATLWTATYVLMGLRYPEELSESLLKGAREMRESVTYQAILEEGKKLGEPAARLQEARSLLLRVGTKRFGAPDDATRHMLDSIVSVDRVEQLIERSLDVESWAELLQ